MSASPSTAGYKLFTPLTIGNDLVLKNRIVLSPMTRARSDPKTFTPVEINEIYYEQRASAGLVITEATFMSVQGTGWYGAPALYSDAHSAAWKKVVDRVHAKGGKIFLQMWHTGRLAHPSFNPKHEVVSASAIAITEGRCRDANGDHADYVLPRALETDEIAQVAEDYRRSASFAKIAGFDGVEIHAANGQLPDTFLQSVSNTRTDKYGGSIENRTRFLLEVIEAIKKEFPSDRIAVRLAPNGTFAGMGSADNYEQFMYTMEQLGKLNFAYLAVLEGRSGFGDHDKGRLVTALDAKNAFRGLVIGNGGYTRDLAEGAIRSGAVDAVCFGRPYMANPDLVERFQNDWPLNEPTAYEHWWDAGFGATGYTDLQPYAPE